MFFICKFDQAPCFIFKFLQNNSSSFLESYLPVTNGWCSGCQMTFSNGYIYGIHAPVKVPSKKCSRLNTGWPALFLTSLIYSSAGQEETSSVICKCIPWIKGRRRISSRNSRNRSSSSDTQFVCPIIALYKILWMLTSMRSIWKNIPKA